MKSFWNDTLGMVYYQPIGGYVIFTWLCMLLTIAISIYSYLEMKCSGSTTENAQTAMLVTLVCAVIHCLCVFWIQRRILKSIRKTMDAEYQEKGTPEEARDYDIEDNYKSRVRTAICEVLKYDFVFCLYFFFAPAAFGVGCWGMTLLNDKNGCTEASYASWAFGILIFYNLCGGLYFFFLMCGIACGAGKEKVKTQVKKTKGKGASGV